MNQSEIKNYTWRKHILSYSSILFCVLLAGCANTGDAVYSSLFRIKIEDVSKLSSDDLQQLQHIPFFLPDKDQKFTSKGQVKGISCKLSVGSSIPLWMWKPTLSELNGNTPEEAAKIQLKLRALRSGGNAVLFPTCTHNESFDWGGNIFCILSILVVHLVKG